ncbi:hypothetical protein [Alsobacter sp. SYSU BS001988]
MARPKNIMQSGGYTPPSKVDFSEEQWESLRSALGLAEPFDGELRCSIVRISDEYLASLAYAESASSVATVRRELERWSDSLGRLNAMWLALRNDDSNTTQFIRRAMMEFDRFRFSRCANNELDEYDNLDETKEASSPPSKGRRLDQTFESIRDVSDGVNLALARVVAQLAASGESGGNPVPFYPFVRMLRDELALRGVKATARQDYDAYERRSPFLAFVRELQISLKLFPQHDRTVARALAWKPDSSS